ncbi:hypothetical protein CLOSTHATH_05530 [Hungatella hathewayi DSM 13479]|uniref:Uncharacterized protein n=1 Tax=Hungatella hathewayi DSM 13479 TaxID=566550 RepID=D3APH9_9FIRM|nr:hypothetical protein CLOSTHATH_05530 [Hungatella hathewayi DSM 13479]
MRIVSGSIDNAGSEVLCILLQPPSIDIKSSIKKVMTGNHFCFNFSPYR